MGLTLVFTSWKILSNEREKDLTWKEMVGPQMSQQTPKLIHMREYKGMGHSHFSFKTMTVSLPRGQVCCISEQQSLLL